jgi:hypothetical protein
MAKNKCFEMFLIIKKSIDPILMYKNGRKNKKFVDLTFRSEFEKQILSTRRSFLRQFWTSSGTWRLSQLLPGLPDFSWSKHTKLGKL